MNESRKFTVNADILLISDSPSIINFITMLLKQNGYNVRSASGGESAVQSALDHIPDLILLKINVSESDGYGLCKLFKENNILHDIPIIYICPDEKIVDKDKIFTSGGLDYITKPFSINEALARIETHLKLSFMKKHNDELEKKVLYQERQMHETTDELKEFNIMIEQEINTYNRIQEELTKARGEAEKAASVDYLTGLLNRRAFSARFDIELSRISRTKSSIGFILTDIDHFKNINDIYSHQIGDIVLQRFSKCITAVARPYDFIGRHGGEEFLICLPDTNFKEVCGIAERMRSEVEKMDILIDGIKDVIKITASFGVAIYLDGSSETLSSMIHKADNELYKAKNKGRNKVSFPD
jgi:diguanylate cyclase (GGDEF)-like protein